MPRHQPRPSIAIVINCLLPIAMVHDDDRPILGLKNEINNSSSNSQFYN